MSARAVLRAATAAQHEGVDALFSRFDLSDPTSYGAFLTAHARALPAVERALAGVSDQPSFDPRTPLLENDLAALGLSAPVPLPFSTPTSRAQALGMLYVIEGSRLGGAILARRVPAGLPHAYLSATHAPGAWRAFGEMLDRESDGPDWLRQAAAAAGGTFDLYARAAAGG